MQRISDFIIGAGILQGFFLAFYIWFSKKPASLPNRILAVLMGVFALNLLHSLIRTAPRLGMPSGGIIEPFQLLLGPLLYLYLSKRMSGGKLKPADGLHSLPFAFVLVLLSVKAVPSAGLVFWILVFLQISGYFFVCFHLVQKYNHAVTAFYSEIRTKNLRWMNGFMVILLVIFAGYLCLFFILFHSGDRPHFERLLSFMQSMAVYGFGAFSLIFDSPLPETALTEPGPSYKKSQIAADSLDGLKEKLSLLMEEKKFHLDPELTLPMLALNTGIPRNTLSQLINEGFGKNFYDFVNSYRVAEVISLMNSEKKNDDKLLTLAFEAGFNSKPAFNAIFRKATGQTPSEYRKTVQ